MKNLGIDANDIMDISVMFKRMLVFLEELLNRILTAMGKDTVDFISEEDA